MKQSTNYMLIALSLLVFSVSSCDNTKSVNLLEKNSGLEIPPGEGSVALLNFDYSKAFIPFSKAFRKEEGSVLLKVPKEYRGRMSCLTAFNNFTVKAAHRYSLSIKANLPVQGNDIIFYVSFFKNEKAVYTEKILGFYRNSTEKYTTGMKEVLADFASPSGVDSATIFTVIQSMKGKSLSSK